MPNLIKRLFRTKSVGTTITTLLNGFEHSTDIRSLNAYKDSLYLYIGVSMIAKRVAGIPLELYKIKNKKGDVTEVFDHPLLQLFNTPNELETQMEFWELSVTYYLLSGDCFWYLDRTGSGIAQMVALRPDYVEIILSPDGKRIVAYEYRVNTIQRFRPEDVLHIKNIDPTNPLRGSGVVRPASSRIATETEATRYQANFFKNQGRPDMAVFTNSTVTEEAAEDFRRRWKSVFGGKNNGSVGVFGNNVTSVEELNKTPKEMDFIETQKFLRMDILSALHIPEEMVSSDGSNRATSKEAYKMYLQEAVIPVLKAFLNIINNKLVPQMDQALFFKFTDPTPVDRELKLKETTELKKVGIITANEGRALYDYDVMEGGDELSSAGSNNARIEVQEEAKQFLRKRPLLVKKLEAMEKVAALAELSAPKREMNSIFATKAMKDAYAKAYNNKVDRKAETVKEALDAFHDGMLTRVLATDLSANAFMDAQSEKIAAKGIFTPIMVKLYKDGGQDALDALFKKSDTNFFADAVLLAAIEGRVNFFTNSIVDTTFEVLKSKIVAGVQAGQGVEEIGRSIRDYFTDMSVKRAKTIAQTETGFVLSKATNDAYQQSSVVTGKEWLTVGDDRVRDEHVENNGVIVAKGGAFPSGEAYPAEHSVNCRCVLLPAV